MSRSLPRASSVLLGSTLARLLLRRCIIVGPCAQPAPLKKPSPGLLSVSRRGNDAQNGDLAADDRSLPPTTRFYTRPLSFVCLSLQKFTIVPHTHPSLDGQRRRRRRRGRWNHGRESGGKRTLVGHSGLCGGGRQTHSRYDEKDPQAKLAHLNLQRQANNRASGKFWLPQLHLSPPPIPFSSKRHHEDLRRVRARARAA